MRENKQEMTLRVIGHVYNDYAGKFGVPRQSGLVDEVISRVVMEPQFRRAEAFRGLAGFSHIWLLWQFSEVEYDKKTDGEWRPTVRPPRLGGNRRVGVFASRSPWRPNPIGLSCVRLLAVCEEPELGPVLQVAGADMLSGTPIYDIKPYLPYADARPEAAAGFGLLPGEGELAVDIPEELLAQLPAEKRQALRAVLAQDPRPGYQEEPERVYGLSFGGFNVRFCVAEGVLRVLDIEKE